MLTKIQHPCYQVGQVMIFNDNYNTKISSIKTIRRVNSEWFYQTDAFSFTENCKNITPYSIDNEIYAVL